VEFFILPGKSACLPDRPHHLLALLGTNGIDWSRGSAIDAKDSATKLTGRSGLSIAARPTRAQNSICPDIVRCSTMASIFACSYNFWSIRIEVVTGMIKLLYYFTTFVVEVYQIADENENFQAGGWARPLVSKLDVEPSSIRLNAMLTLTQSN
jgi:hypothetical protein